MKPPREPFTRRRFLAAGGAALAVAAALRSTETNPAAGVSPAKRTLKKGIMWGTLGDLKGTVLEKMRAIKAAGFDGAEMMSHMDVDEVLRARDATGLVIPSVCGALHWAKPLSDPNPAVRATGLAGLRQALHDARRYGATSVLLVPAVAKADVPYDVAYARSQEEIRKAIPLAEELGVKIALENVRNYFLLTPLEAARYVDEFGTPAVGWHFDVGNSLHYGWPEHWIHILGPRPTTSSGTSQPTKTSPSPAMCC